MAFEPGIPSISGNPFVSVSTSPEGTSFIAVGSISSGLIVIVLCWRLYAIWATHRAARNNEARFTALEPSYGGPFVDPVDRRTSYLADSETFSEKNEPEMHPIGVPLNQSGKKPRRKSTADRPKSQVERMREAQSHGKFFSPTADVLKHGSALPPSLLSGNTGTNNPSAGPGTFGYNHSGNSRSSVLRSGRNSMMQQATMSISDFGNFDAASQAPSSNYGSASSRPHSRAPSIGVPLGPIEGTMNPPTSANPRPKKSRPPSTYLDDLVG